VQGLRIAVVANTAWNLVNFRLNLMKALRAAGHEVIAVAPHDPVQAQRLKEVGVMFTPVAISGSGTNPLRELQSIIALRRVLRRHGVKAVLSYTPKGNLYSSLAALSCRLPFLPNVSGLGRAFISKSWVTMVVRGLYRLTLGRAHKVFFQNLDDMGLFLQAGLVPRERCERLPGSGVDVSRFALQPLPDHKSDAPVFLLVARLMWDKGVGEFAEAARAVLKRYPQARFQLLGFFDVDNPSAVPRAQLQDWESEGVLTYLGPTDDVRSFLAQADCVVLPSYREGVPRTLLEAAAMGRPVITTDAPGCRDAVVDGVTGWLCRTADAGDLARCMLTFVTTPVVEREAMGQRGRQRVEAEFDEHLVFQAYLREVRVLASGDSPIRSGRRAKRHSLAERG
jgi:glycosyltransferase involved in cell wall biosynthesis